MNYIRRIIGLFFWVLDKINKRAYIKLFPKYLRWLGIDINDENVIGTWISPRTFFDSSHYDYISIGEKVTISFGVTTLVHDYSIMHAARAVKKEIKDIIYRTVKIGNNCFIGAKVIILPNTDIGDNCIIGSGSVVKGICEPNSVYIGNPCKRICSVDEYLYKYKDLLKE